MSSVPAGVCILSVDIGAGASGGRGETSNLFLQDLCRRFAGADLPVTWSVNEAPADGLRRAIEGHRGCELALLADSSWAADGPHRGHFCDALARRLAATRSAGFAPTTLCLPGGELATHDDLLVRHGITAVRVTASRRQVPRVAWWRRGRSALKPIRPLRWGLWEVSVNVNPGTAGLATAGRMIDRVTRQAGVAVVAVDAATLQRDAKGLSRFIDHLERRRDEKLLTIETVAAGVARQQAPRQKPARSILRPAAA